MLLSQRGHSSPNMNRLALLLMRLFSFLSSGGLSPFITIYLFGICLLHKDRTVPPQPHHCKASASKASATWHSSIAIKYVNLHWSSFQRELSLRVFPLFLFVFSPVGGLDWHWRDAFGTLNLPGSIIPVLKSLWIPVECFFPPWHSVS